ncbi:MAG TPA: hypothetical protein VH682_31760 [Gemmataceae bacterium]|jgi:hypothetical protein
MPNIPKKSDEVYPPREGDGAFDLQRIENFLLSMRESKRNPDNLWTRWDDDRILTIFHNKWGKFQWSISDSESVQYSKRSFSTQEEAAQALLDALDEEGQ